VKTAVRLPSSSSLYQDPRMYCHQLGMCHHAHVRSREGRGLKDGHNEADAHNLLRVRHERNAESAESPGTDTEREPEAGRDASRSQDEGASKLEMIDIVPREAVLTGNLTDDVTGGETGLCHGVVVSFTSATTPHLRDHSTHPGSRRQCAFPSRRRLPSWRGRDLRRVSTLFFAFRVACSQLIQ
jgi:hypothetical protein